MCVCVCPRYGVLNLTNDPHGVGACFGYGDSHFILKNVSVRARGCVLCPPAITPVCLSLQVRLRTTLSDMDRQATSPLFLVLCVMV